MKQILRFNKIIKSIIIAGDLCILNALFVTLYYVLDTDTSVSFSPIHCRNCWYCWIWSISYVTIPKESYFIAASYVQTTS